MPWRPATMSSAATLLPAPLYVVAPTQPAIKATFCLPRQRRNSINCAFPLGAEMKPNVREMADDDGPSRCRRNPTVRTSASSQTGRYASIVEKLRPDAASPGTIEHVDGRVLGEHKGIIHYTVGQRSGLGIAEAAPLYVVALDAPGRRVIVGPREALLTSKLKLRA